MTPRNSRSRRTNVPVSQLIAGDIVESPLGYETTVTWVMPEPTADGRVKLAIASLPKDGLPFTAWQELDPNQEVTLLRRTGWQPKWINELAGLRAGNEVVVTADSHPRPYFQILPQLDYYKDTEWFRGESGVVTYVDGYYAGVRLPPGDGMKSIGVDALQALNLKVPAPPDRVARIHVAELIWAGTCREFVESARLEQQAMWNRVLDPANPRDASEIYRRMDMREVTISGKTYGVFESYYFDKHNRVINVLVHEGRGVAELHTSFDWMGLSIDDIRVAVDYRREGLASYLIGERAKAYLSANPDDAVYAFSHTPDLAALWTKLEGQGKVPPSKYDYVGKPIPPNEDANWNGYPAGECLLQWDDVLVRDITDTERFGPDTTDQNFMMYTREDVLVTWGHLAPSLQPLPTPVPSLNNELPIDMGGPPFF